MRVAKMLTEKSYLRLYFLWPGLYRRMIQEVKMALVFAFPKLLSVIRYLYRKKNHFWKLLYCYIVTLVTQK